MRRKLFHRSDDSTELEMVNLTPLLDVLFVVLILFILVAPLLEIDKIDLASSQTSTKKEEFSQGACKIQVRSDNTILLNGSMVSTTRLLDKLKTIYASHNSLTPQLFQDKHSSFGTYQVVKNQVSLAGFEEIDVVLLP